MKKKEKSQKILRQIPPNDLLFYEESAILREIAKKENSNEIKKNAFKTGLKINKPGSKIKKRGNSRGKLNQNQEEKCEKKKTKKTKEKLGKSKKQRVFTCSKKNAKLKNNLEVIKVNNQKNLSVSKTLQKQPSISNIKSNSNFYKIDLNLPKELKKDKNDFNRNQTLKDKVFKENQQKTRENEDTLKKKEFQDKLTRTRSKKFDKKKCKDNGDSCEKNISVERNFQRMKMTGFSKKYFSPEHCIKKSSSNEKCKKLYRKKSPEIKKSLETKPNSKVNKKEEKQLVKNKIVENSEKQKKNSKKKGTQKEFFVKEYKNWEKMEKMLLEIKDKLCEETKIKKDQNLTQNLKKMLKQAMKNKKNVEKEIVNKNSVFDMKISFSTKNLKGNSCEKKESKNNLKENNQVFFISKKSQPQTDLKKNEIEDRKNYFFHAPNKPKKSSHFLKDIEKKNKPKNYEIEKIRKIFNNKHRSKNQSEDDKILIKLENKVTSSRNCIKNSDQFVMNNILNLNFSQEKKIETNGIINTKNNLDNYGFQTKENNEENLDKSPNKKNTKNSLKKMTIISKESLQSQDKIFKNKELEKINRIFKNSKNKKMNCSKNSSQKKHQIESENCCPNGKTATQDKNSSPNKNSDSSKNKILLKKKEIIETLLTDENKDVCLSSAQECNEQPKSIPFNRKFSVNKNNTQSSREKNKLNKNTYLNRCFNKEKNISVNSGIKKEIDLYSNNYFGKSFDDLKKEENYNSHYIDSSEEEDLIQADKKPIKLLLKLKNTSNDDEKSCSKKISKQPSENVFLSLKKDNSEKWQKPRKKTSLEIISNNISMKFQNIPSIISKSNISKAKFCIKKDSFHSQTMNENFIIKKRKKNLPLLSLQNLEFQNKSHLELSENFQRSFNKSFREIGIDYSKQKKKIKIVKNNSVNLIEDKNEKDYFFRSNLQINLQSLINNESQPFYREKSELSRKNADRENSFIDNKIEKIPLTQISNIITNRNESKEISIYDIDDKLNSYILEKNENKNKIDFNIKPDNEDFVLMINMNSENEEDSKIEKFKKFDKNIKEKVDTLESCRDDIKKEKDNICLNSLEMFLKKKEKEEETLIVSESISLRKKIIESEVIDFLVIDILSERIFFEKLSFYCIEKNDLNQQLQEFRGNSNLSMENEKGYLINKRNFVEFNNQDKISENEENYKDNENSSKSEETIYAIRTHFSAVIEYLLILLDNFSQKNFFSLDQVIKKSSKTFDKQELFRILFMNNEWDFLQHLVQYFFDKKKLDENFEKMERKILKNCQNLEKMENLIKIQNFYHKSIFDCFFEEMAQFILETCVRRDFSINHCHTVLNEFPPLPVLLQQTRERVLENAGFLCGVIRDKEDSMMGDIRFIDDYTLFSLKEERMMRFIIFTILSSQKLWVCFEKEKKELFDFVFNLVFDTLLDDLIYNFF